MWRGPSMAVPPRNISRAWRVALNCRLLRPGVVVKPTGSEGPADAVVSDVLQQSQRQPCADCPTGRVRLGRPPLRSRTTSSKSSTQIPVQPPGRLWRWLSSCPRRPSAAGRSRRPRRSPCPSAHAVVVADTVVAPISMSLSNVQRPRYRRPGRLRSLAMVGSVIAATGKWPARRRPSPRHTWSRPARTAACGAVLRSVGLAVPRPGSARWDIPLHHDTEIGRIPAVCRLTGGGGGTGGEPSLSPIVDQPPSAPPCPGLPMEETPATSIILSCQLNGCCDPVPALKQEPERAAAKWRAAFRSGSRAHDLRRVGSGQCASK
jgi:hypothetical protein